MRVSWARVTHDVRRPQLVESTVQLLESSEPDATADDDDDDEANPVVDETGGGTSFNVLHYAARVDNDPFASVSADLRLLFASSLAELSRAHPGQLASLFSHLTPACAQALAKYCRDANVQIV